MKSPHLIEVLVSLKLLGSVKLVLSSWGCGRSTHPSSLRPHRVLESFELGWVEFRAGPQGRRHTSLFHRCHGVEFCGPGIGSHRSTEHRRVMPEILMYCSSHIIKVKSTVGILLGVEVTELWQMSIPVFGFMLTRTARAITAS